MHMICVAIGEQRIDDVLAAQRRLADAGAKLVELRLDYLQEPISLRRLLEHRPTPVIVTCRRPRDGGRFNGPEQQRLELLQAAVAAGADYVDLEADVAAQISRSGSTRRIVSHHDFERTPDDVEAIHQRLSLLGADVVKLVTTATTPHDNRRLLALSAAAKIPTIAFCMGDIGVASRILAGRFGAPWTYAADSNNAVAPGQVSFQQLRDLYRYESIGPETDVYGVIADPVGHSLSPLIHNTAFRELGLNKVYVPLRIPPANLAEFMQDAPHLGLRGLSITIPHKEAVIASLGQADDAVRGIGACNTAIYDGRQWSGHNTDNQAAMDSLEEAYGAAPGSVGSLSASPLAGKRAILLGAGGVGKAIAVGLMRRGATVALCDAMQERAEQLAARLGCSWVAWGVRHDVPVDVIVNCTPVGMHPKVDDTPYDAACLKPGMVVFDAVYNPEYTRLLQDAQSLGCRVVSGVEMFVRQAALQFKMFTGQPAPTALMRQVILEALGHK